MSKPHAKSRAAKIRTLLRVNPNITADDLVSKFDITKQSAYVQLSTLRKELGVVRGFDGKYRHKIRMEIKTPAKAGSLVKTDDAPRIVAAFVTKTPLKGGTLVKTADAPRIVLEHFGVDIDKAHDPVNHPEHYKTGGIETIDFIEGKQLNYNLGNVVKYVTRADHKGNRLEDLEKARWYLDREIGNLSEKLATSK
jgi:hypothetical protein